ncbi:N-acetylmuramoyl-L-alanine amidase-like domain-containing protein [Muriicola jejuensis]|uniref:DUF1460 domain-containing protein n=1 Tax=Muriicola jejuensis TaxID=504488 RepID=A0A6P0UD10_9FLAO|nr:N-acetylmuramoyl-L-alanine amidase-like domain-containing protein [Muriicola jejuensis]NER09799.1 DUF1460 domain-containing protein [Muriicola jejuensis]
MKSIILSSFALIFSWCCSAQDYSCSPENREAVASKIEEIRGIRESSAGEQLITIGKAFLGTPYVAKTLEGNPSETLVIDLQGLDCTTFVENVLAFGLIRREGDLTFDAFLRALEKVRYREGILQGYSSRLHYFTEWLDDNEEKELVMNITSRLGGIEVPKELHFMSRHRDLYPALSKENTYEDMIQIEKKISKNPICVLPLDTLAENENMLESGDIIALATSIEGLDVTHTGFAIRMPDNRIHLLHASATGKVEISELPLVDYLKKIRNNTGIIVARPVF